MFWSFTPLFNSLTTFPAERAIIIKERASGSYRLSAYFLSKVVAEAPVELAYPVVFLCIAYWMVGFHTSAGGFFFTVLTILLSTLCAQSYGLLISCTLLDFKQSITFASVSMLTLMLLSGFYVKLEKIPVWLRWATYLVFRTCSCTLRKDGQGVTAVGWGGVGVQQAAINHGVGVAGQRLAFWSINPFTLFRVHVWSVLCMSDFQPNTRTASLATFNFTTTISHAATPQSSRLEVRLTRTAATKRPLHTNSHAGLLLLLLLTLPLAPVIFISPVDAPCRCRLCVSIRFRQ